MLVLLTAIIFAITLIGQTSVSGGPVWDTINALGFIAFAGMLYLFMEIGGGLRTRAHQLISYGVAGAICIHITAHIAYDHTIWYYLTLNAPMYMVAGLIAVALIVATIVLAIPKWRRRWAQPRATFLRWHYWLSLVAIALAAYHVAATQFYLDSDIEIALFAALCLGLVAMHRFRHRPATTTQIQILCIPVLAATFVLFKWALN